MPIVLVVANSNNLSNLKELIAAKAAPTTLRISFEYWLGWQDSNLRMPGSKPGALPLGDTPKSQTVFDANETTAGAGSAAIKCRLIPDRA